MTEANQNTPKISATHQPLGDLIPSELAITVGVTSELNVEVGPTKLTVR